MAGEEIKHCTPFKCEKEAIIDEIHAEQKATTERMHEGDLRFQKLEDKLNQNGETGDATYAAVQKINKRLFIDNGTKSHQTKIDRHDQLLKGLLWAMGITCSTLIVAIIGLIAKAVLHSTGG